MTSGSGEGWGPVRGPLARDHPVSLRRQLAAVLEAAIRDRHLRPGARLPSTRDLARRLGVHRSTVNAAYARLRRRGCVEGRARGRLIVMEASEWVAADPTAAALAAGCVGEVLRRAAATGTPRRYALSALARVAGELADVSRSDAGAPLLVEPRPGLRQVLAAELERRLGVSIPAARSLPRGGWSGPVLLRPEVGARLENGRVESGCPLRPLELIPLPLAGGTRERGIVRRSVRGGVVALVSVSGSVRRHARDLAAREFERGVSFTAIDPGDRAEVVRAVGVARLVLYDEASRDAIPGTPVSSAAIRLIPPGPIAGLRGYLGLIPDLHDPRRGT